jgi:hypothetical protein
MDRSEFHCPTCRSSETIKVSMAFERDALYSRSHGYAGSMRTTTQTKLGMRLAPPQQAKWSSGTQWALVGIVIFGLAGLGSFLEAVGSLLEEVGPDAKLASTFAETPIGKTLVGLVFMCFAIVCGWAFYRGKKKTNEWNATDYPRLLAEWNSNWLCEKCGAIFNVP